MAKVEKILSFLMKYEAGLSESFFNRPLEEQFAKAKETGFACDPADTGGATMVGVTIGTFTEYCRRRKMGRPSVSDLKSITFQQWTDIVKMMYWDRWKADRIKNQSVANILFDWVWSSGVHGIKWPQRLLGVADDGIVGPKTLEAINRSNPTVLYRAILNSRIDFVNDICHSSVVRYEHKIGRKATQSEIMRHTNMRFKKGWLRRINDIANI